MQMFHILFLCTHNRCRSILCEAIVNAKADGLMRASSAGSAPQGQVHPMTLKYLGARGYPTGGLESKSWDRFRDDLPDLVVTVCDAAAAEACPVWLGVTEKVHWSLKDPSKLSSPSEQEAAFHQIIDEIEGQVPQWMKRAVEVRRVSDKTKKTHRD